ncbi:hypothetical protein MAPG_11323 [Magnaporthiopsis poae ATCC 64411]|uniref:Uncharacterized protein n=1 Tax=Magnaporthiopsis poae (strain ATCC 64411 / 73-15) TaxID=644358 RepID=A0A0C4EEZ1_MAGP6|nr:hypothetical protein MAPG_11323 [Magnaporthiopsis poae ATCC 64411]
MGTYESIDLDGEQADFLDYLEKGQVDPAVQIHQSWITHKQLDQGYHESPVSFLTKWQVSAQKIKPEASRTGPQQLSRLSREFSFHLQDWLQDELQQTRRPTGIPPGTLATQAVGSSAYEVRLPAKHSRLHSVFTLLEPWNDFRPRVSNSTLPDLEEETEEWEVEDVVNMQEQDGSCSFW